MTYPLTLSGAAFGSGKFGTALTSGYGSASSFPTGNVFTFEAWVKTTASGGTNKVLFSTGAYNNFYMGMDPSGNLVWTATPTITAPAINDGVWHHIEISGDASATRIFLDGVLVGTGAAESLAAPSANSQFTIGAHQTLGYNWVGSIDEVAAWSVTRHTANFTPPSAPIDGTTAGLYQLYHLDGNGNDSIGVATAADTTAPSMVGSLSSSAITATGYMLSWTAGTDNVGVAGYEYSTDGSATWSDAGNVLSKTITGLAASTTYHNLVRDYDAAGNRSTPISLDVTTTATTDATAPTMNGTLGVSSITSSGGTLSWSAGSDNVGVAGYEYSLNGTTWTDVGNVLTKTVSGLSSSTAYSPQVRDYDAAGNRSTAISTTFTTAAATTALTGNTSNVLFSPYNWNVDANTAKTINGGAYFKTVFGGTSCTLQFDTTGLATGFPKLEYRVDGTGPWTTVDLAASVPIAIPAETAAYASHLLEVNVRATTRTNRWALGGLVALIGIVLDSGKSLAKPGQSSRNMLVFGDSITEGLKSLSSSEDTVNSSNGMQSYASIAGRMLGAEVGVVGFSGQGFTHQGDGPVPVFGSTYNFLYSGVARSFSPTPDYIVINQGTNDSTNDITSAAVGVLNGLISATPATTKIIVLRPFNGNQAANLQAAIAACSAPARVTYVDTTGFFNSGNSGDGLHPYGWEHITHIAPQVATAVRNVAAAAPTLTARTVTLTLATGLDTSGNPIPAANLTGMKVSFFDEPTPDKHSVARYNTATGTTNASGVMTFQAQSTLSPGSSGSVDVQTANGDNLFATVMVS